MTPMSHLENVRSLFFRGSRAAIDGIFGNR